MKWLIYLTALAVAVLAPVKRTDVGKLQPVELIYVYMEEGVTIETDTGDIGKGTTVDAAIENLKETTPGIVYLDTAEYLLLDPNAEAELRHLQRHLEGNIRVCYLEGETALPDAAKYLDIHKPKITLNAWERTKEKQLLRGADGILMLE